MYRSGLLPTGAALDSGIGADHLLAGHTKVIRCDNGPENINGAAQTSASRRAFQPAPARFKPSMIRLSVELDSLL